MKLLNFLEWPILVYVIGILYLSLLPRSENTDYLSGIVAVCPFLMSIYIWYTYILQATDGFAFISSRAVLPEYSIHFALAIDGLSLSLIMLTSYMACICVLVAQTAQNRQSLRIYILLTTLFLNLAFMSTNLFFFYVFFEAALLPMILIIGIWGSRERKMHAGYYLFLYTLVGGFFLMYAIFSVYQLTGTLDYFLLNKGFLSRADQISVWIFFFIPFAIKIPMVPFHLWLPEAHVEAPTVGSIILAAVLLKLGVYGMFRFCIDMLPEAKDYYLSAVDALALIGVIYGGFSAMRHHDLKKIIAYTSIAHMNLIVMGLFSGETAMLGAVYFMIGHGFVSAGLFHCVGILYERFGTRSIQHYSGLAQVMPTFAAFLFIFTCANMGFPGTCNFVGEFLIFTGLWEQNPFVMFFAGTGIIASAIYGIWLFNRVCFGTLKIEKENGACPPAPLTRNEMIVLVALALPVLILGLKSSLLTALIVLPIKAIWTKF